MKALFIELSEMGSAVLADPAMQLLKRKTNADILFLIFERNKESLNLLQTVGKENIFVIRDSNLFTLFLDTLKFILLVRKLRIDVVFDLEIFSRYSALLTQLSGIRKKVGFHGFFQHGLYRGNFLSHKVAYNPHIHIAKNFIALVEAGTSEKHETPYLKAEIDDRLIQLNRFRTSVRQRKIVHKKIDSWLSPAGTRDIIIFNVNASNLIPQRRWPPQNFAELARQVLRKIKRCSIVFIGAAEDSVYVQNVVELVSDTRAINLAGRLPVVELPYLFERAAWMLTNDSAPAHFASVTRLKTFILYGPETPRLYSALGNAVPIYANLACSPCVTASNHRRTACDDNICMQILSVQRVWSVLKQEQAAGVI